MNRRGGFWLPRRFFFSSHLYPAVKDSAAAPSIVDRSLFTQDRLVGLGAARRTFIVPFITKRGLWCYTGDEEEDSMVCRMLSGLVMLLATAIPLAAQMFSFGTGDAGLDISLNSINVQAQANIGSFTADLSVSFGVPQTQIQAWITVEKLQPAELYFALELSRIAAKPAATVFEIYRANKGKGWGAVAKALGIKPGSPEFRALKAKVVDKDKAIKAGKKK